MKISRQSLKSSAAKLGKQFKPPVVAALIIGIVIGSIATHMLANGKRRVSDNRRTEMVQDKEVANEALQEATRKRIEAGYKRVKKRVADEVASQKLTKKQAEVLLKKIDEAYRYRIGVDSSDKARLEQRAKRKEWQNWAREQKISAGYFTVFY